MIDADCIESESESDSESPAPPSQPRQAPPSLASLPLAVVDAFCGVGGVGIAARELGFGIRLAIDSDEDILDLYQSNMGLKNASVLHRTITDAVVDAEWPEAVPRLLLHWSAPCQKLSRLNAHAVGQSDVASAVRLFEAGVRLALRRGYQVFTLEQVNTTLTKQIAEEYKRRFPERVDWRVFCASEYGGASTRSRLIISTPRVIELMRKHPKETSSAAKAFKEARVPLPDGATHLKVTRSNGSGSASTVRPLSKPAPCVTASHPLVFATCDGTSVAQQCCLTAKHSAALLGFPSNVRLPKLTRAAQRAVGNSLDVNFAKVMLSACATYVEECAGAMPPPLDVGGLATLEPQRAPVVAIAPAAPAAAPPFPAKVNKRALLAMLDELEETAFKAATLGRKVRRALDGLLEP